MTLPLIEQFLVRLRAEYPNFPLSIRPYKREDPTIEHFVNVLNVPIEELHHVSDRSWEIAFEVFGEETISFHLTTVDPEQSAEYFPEALEDHRRGQGRIRA